MDHVDDGTQSSSSPSKDGAFDSVDDAITATALIGLCLLEDPELRARLSERVLTDDLRVQLEAAHSRTSAADSELELYETLLNALSPTNASELEAICRDWVDRLGSVDPELEELVFDACIYHLYSESGYEFSGFEDDLEAFLNAPPKLVRVFGSSPRYNFEFQFPRTLTRAGGQEQVNEFTAGVVQQLLALLEGLPAKHNVRGLRVPVRCFYKPRMERWSVRRTASEILGNSSRRTEVKRNHDRISDLLGVDRWEEVKARSLE